MVSGVRNEHSPRQKTTKKCGCWLVVCGTNDDAPARSRRWSAFDERDHRV